MSVKKKRTISDWQGLYHYHRGRFEPKWEQSREMERYYSGEYQISPLVEADKDLMESGDYSTVTARQCVPFVREIIESIIDTSVPQVKVNPVHKKDEWLANIIESTLLTLANRIRTEENIGLAARLVSIEGGATWHISWDGALESSAGANRLEVLPMVRVVPQDGVYTDIQDMDYFFIIIPMTAESVKRVWGKEVTPMETEPQSKGTGGSERGMSAAMDMTEVIRAYYRNEDGGIGVYTWAGQDELEDEPYYFSRLETVCSKCDSVILGSEYVLDAPTFDGGYPENAAKKSAVKGECPYCGGKLKRKRLDFETLGEDILRQDGTVIPAFSPDADDDGEVILDELGALSIVPTQIPVYIPDVYPLVMQRNIQKYGELYGLSDVSALKDLQDIANRSLMKIEDKLFQSGSSIVMPPDAKIRINPKDGRVVESYTPQDVKMFDFEFNVAQDMSMLNYVYEHMKSAVGVTKAWEGNSDYTIQSAKARELAVAQSAGRMESRIKEKELTWAHIYEILFKFLLAFSNAPINSQKYKDDGELEYFTFNRWDFLRQAANSKWEWNTDFVFSIETDAPVANNRSLLWQTNQTMLQSGGFGTLDDAKTWYSFWRAQYDAHMPGAETQMRLAANRVKEQERELAMQREIQTSQLQQQQVSAQSDIELKQRAQESKEQSAQQRYEAQTQKTAIEAERVAGDLELRKQQIELEARLEAYDRAEVKRQEERAQIETLKNRIKEAAANNGYSGE
jgi:hypothetical protein